MLRRLNREKGVAVALGFASFALTLTRLGLGDVRSLTDVLWAEDGLFPLCVSKADALTCTIQPFAGYLLLAPRAVGALVSILPWQWWPAAAVTFAAVAVGFLAAWTYLLLRGTRLSTRTSALATLLLSVAPIVGLETIGSVGSVYVPLLVVSAVAVCTARPWKQGVMSVSLLLMITSLTMPSSVVLYFSIVVLRVRRALALKTAVAWCCAMGVGLIAQAIVVLGSDDRREVVVSREAVRAWADGVTGTVLSAVPGLAWQEAPLTEFASLSAPGYGAWLICGALGLLALWAISSGWRTDSAEALQRLSAGLLVATGLALSLMPSLLGTFSYRYLVAPFVLWGVALLMVTDRWLTQWRWWQFGGVLVIVLALWAPSFPASELRTSPAPSWSDELARISRSCAGSPDIQQSVSFTPVWPGERDLGLVEPTLPVVSCDLIRNELGVAG